MTRALTVSRVQLRRVADCPGRREDNLGSGTAPGSEWWGWPNEADMARHAIEWQDVPPESCRAGALAIGNFDGAHQGHAALMAELVRQAHRVGGPAVALTFDPHPLTLLQPGLSLRLLTTPADRSDQLHHLGVDHVVELRATPSLLQLRAREFFTQVVRQRFQARALVEGTNFGFGKDREGTIDTLEELCREAHLVLRIVPPVILEGIKVSSSRIRDELLQGNVAVAARLLGRPYRVRGVVGTGQQRGRSIGFPTANLEEMATVVPGDGVYAVRVRAETDQMWAGAANIGPNPTFGEDTRKLEVHLIDFHGDLYGHHLAVDFLDRLRDTHPFASVGELVAQLQHDVEAARRMVVLPGEGR